MKGKCAYFARFFFSPGGAWYSVQERAFVKKKRERENIIFEKVNIDHVELRCLFGKIFFDDFIKEAFSRVILMRERFLVGGGVFPSSSSSSLACSLFLCLFCIKNSRSLSHSLSSRSMKTTSTLLSSKHT